MTAWVGGSHKQGKRPGVFFDQQGESALVAADGSMMDHNRMFLAVVGVLVGHAELFRKLEVDLDGDQRVLFAVDVPDL